MNYGILDVVFDNVLFITHKTILPTLDTSLSGVLLERLSASHLRDIVGVFYCLYFKRHKTNSLVFSPDLWSVHRNVCIL